MRFKGMCLVLLFTSFCMVFVQAGDAASTKGKFEIIILNSKDEPLKDVKITMTSTVSATKTYDLKTKKDGKARIVGIDPDDYIIEAVIEGYQGYRKRVDLKPGVLVEERWNLLTLEEALEIEIIGWPKPKRDKYYGELAFNAGYDAYKAGDNETALTKYKEATELQPDREDFYFAYLILGQDAFNNKKVEEAEKYLSKALELDVEKESLLVIGSLLGATYLINEDTENAQRVWMEQVETAPDPDVLYNLAGIEIRENNLDGALKWLQMSAEKFPDVADPIQLLGDVHIQKNNYSEALKAYKLLLTIMQADETTNPDTVKEVMETIKLLEETVQ